MSNNLPTRKEMLQKMENEYFDIIIIGGGITGAGMARDAALRGLKVALVEKNDFASGTSSKTSKMLHGGLRYLKNFEFRLVREAALERKVHLEIAPHLAEVMTFLVPVYKWSSEGKFMLKLGLILYDLLSFPKGIGRHKMISIEDLVDKLPILENDDLVGGAMYNDIKTNDARLTLAVMLSAIDAGATVANYVKAQSWEKNDGGVNVEVSDEENDSTFNVKGKLLIICGGPWTEIIENKGENFDGKAKLRTTWGSHVMLKPKLRDNPCLIINEDERPVFLIPKIGYDLAGTTDVDYDGHPDNVKPTKEDVEYILDACNKLFPTAKYTKDDVVASFAGLRPLVYEKGVTEGEISRDHKIFNDEEAVITVVGGKLTTYRVMAKETLNKALKLLNKSRRNYECITKTTPIYGGDIDDWEEFLHLKTNYLIETFDFDHNTANILVKWYGSKLPLFEKIIKEVGTRKLKNDRPWLEAQVVFSCRFEYARTPIDFLRRRTPIMLEEGNGEDILTKVVELMGDELNWKESTRKSMTNKTLSYIEKFVRVEN